jgi:hypothetical protein
VANWARLTSQGAQKISEKSSVMSAKKGRAREDFSQPCVRVVTAPSARDHAHEDPVLAHEMVMERRPDMGGQ